MSTLVELGDYLEGSLGADPPIFLGSRPDNPDTVLALYIYAGGGPEYVQSSTFPINETVQLQVVARAPHYQDAESLAYRAWRLLAPIRNTFIGGTRYRSITPTSSPSSMGRDSNDRIMVFFNATVEKEVSLA